MANAIEVKVPDIGDFKDVEIIEVLVKPGDAIDIDTPLITLETDKASMDVPSPVSGTVAALRVKEGDRVSEGSLILMLEPAEAGSRVMDHEPQPVVHERGVGSPAPGDAGGGYGGGALEEVRVPDIGDFGDVPVIEVLVRPGDTIRAEDSLITLESDKASMDVPAPKAGRVAEVLVTVGDKVSQGTPILMLEAEGPTHAAPSAPAQAVEPTPAPAPAAASYGGGADLECEMLVLGAGPGGYSAAFRAASASVPPTTKCMPWRNFTSSGWRPAATACSRTAAVYFAATSVLGASVKVASALAAQNCWPRPELPAWKSTGVRCGDGAARWGPSIEYRGPRW